MNPLTLSAFSHTQRTGHSCATSSTRATVGLSVVTWCHPSYLDSTQRLYDLSLFPGSPRKSWQLEGVSHSYTHSHCGPAPSKKHTQRPYFERQKSFSSVFGCGFCSEKRREKKENNAHSIPQSHQRKRTELPDVGHPAHSRPTSPQHLPAAGKGE